MRIACGIVHSHRLALVSCVLLVGLLGCKDPRNEFPPVRYNLSLQGGAVEVPASTTTGTGTLTGEYNRITRVLTMHIIFDFGASGEKAFISHIHKGAVGVQGGIEFAVKTWPVPNDVASGNFTFSITLTESQAEDLLSGNYYYNLHTNNNPLGALRAQLVGS